MSQECGRAEILAGAVALGEATDTERDSYRRHLAGCRRCIGRFGGEREIERVMRTVALARDAETWQPDVRGTLANAPLLRRRRWTAAILAAGATLAFAAAAFALVVRTGSPLAASRQVASSNPVFRVELERRPPVATQPRPQTHAAPDRGLVVVHNVVTLTRPVVRAQAPVAHPKPAAAAAAAVATTVAALGPSARDERSIAAMQTVASAPLPAERAESMAVVPPVVREVAPVGGDGAIVPHPSAIAYDEDAQGTTAFDVAVDDSGNPTKCTITKTSGYLVLDVAVCKAAMRARYVPRTVNGRATAGVYHDAFTFRASQGE